MIPAVHPRGTNVGGLLRYLFGPGKREEHSHARLVAAWADAGNLTELEPPTDANGRRDVRRLAELLEQPVSVGRKPPAKPVWHCSIRTHPTDRLLSDEQWAHIAAEVMAAVGLAPHGDARAVRWVAVRHAADHIHLVATRVRQDRRTAWTSYDYRKAQAACRDLEERYGLYRVAPAGHGSRRWPTPAELNKAARLHAKTGSAKAGRRTVAPRDDLRRRVREVAAIATDEADFFARLNHAGVRVKPRYSARNPGEVTGYAVGLDGHTTTAGNIVWYGGGRLAPDLTLPQLRSRWTGTPPPGRTNAARLAGIGMIPPEMSRRAAEMVREAIAAMRVAPSPGVASAIGYAAADLLNATARAWEGRTGGPLTDAAQWFDRAAHDLRGRVPARRVSQAGHLRAMARLIAIWGTLSRDQDTIAALQFLHAVAAFAETLADLREAQEQLHQAQAARHAIGRLRAYQLPAGPLDARPPSHQPTQQAAPALAPWPAQRGRHR
ncbi:relaxase/mobilization nuclease domain-containing protein [Phytohabitans rumicis]|uniref:Mobilization protein n=1 Tax=Phytohabitans rumicis TaxID=1076125 RepID=A0A6V8L4K1_9ACTN|nr:relaxase [Phytohabitans rumicis]GFJ92192.1 mobilization protein [Phytohabitans rumicis]